MIALARPGEFFQHLLRHLLLSFASRSFSVNNRSQLSRSTFRLVVDDDVIELFITLDFATRIPQAQVKIGRHFRAARYQALAQYLERRGKDKDADRLRDKMPYALCALHINFK